MSAVVIAVVLVAFTQQPQKAGFDELYFQYSEDDISNSNLINPSNWDLISLPATGCDEGEIPCVVKIEGLTDYGSGYSNGVVDEVDFAHYLDLQGETNAQAYVTGENMEASKD